jgi:hypothetical protein
VGWPFAIALATLLALCLVPVLVRPTEFIHDDSFFYLQIASQVFAGHGSTFHGVTPTNGYHPLWMACVIAAMTLAGGDKDIAIVVVVLLQVLLIAAALVLFLRLMRDLALEYWQPGLVLLASYLLGTALFASEAHLNAFLLLAATLSLWRALQDAGDTGWFRAGLLFGAAILSRLDNIFVAAALLAFGILCDRPWRPSRLVRRSVAAGLGAALLVAPYLAWNYVEYRHFMPISGAIKSWFPPVAVDLRRLGTLGQLAVPLGLTTLVISALLDRDRKRRVVWFGLGVGVLLHAMYVVAFTDHYTFWGWYYVSAVIAASAAASALTGWLMVRLRPAIGDAAGARLVGVAAVVLLAAFAARAWLKAFNPIRVGPVVIDVQVNEYRWAEELAQWMRANLPAGSVVFAQDWPGAIAYYSGIPMLPMDGLVSDFQYNDELLRTGVQPYLCSHGVGYFFGHLGDPANAHAVPVIAPVDRKPAGILTLQPDDLVVETRAVLKRPDEAPPFAIWRIQCPAPEG